MTARVIEAEFRRPVEINPAILVPMLELERNLLLDIEHELFSDQRLRPGLYAKAVAALSANAAALIAAGVDPFTLRMKR